MAKALIRIVLLVVTFSVCAVTVLMCVRTSYWIFAESSPNWGSPISAARDAARRSSNKNNLKLIGLAHHNYHDMSDSFPQGGTFREDGTGLHSWMTPIGPYLTFYIDDLHEDEPWNSPHNAKYFKSVLPIYLNPSLAAAPVVDEAGFALSHYASNQHVMGPNLGLTFEHITDGTANTLLIGEVFSRFQPWGKPTNWRDPRQGLNKSTFGFGSRPDFGGMMFVMADGSVKYFSETIDPKILNALATPHGGEKIPVGSF